VQHGKRDWLMPIKDQPRLGSSMPGDEIADVAG
jgi:hypothetical protein